MDTLILLVGDIRGGGTPVGASGATGIRTTGRLKLGTIGPRGTNPSVGVCMPVDPVPPSDDLLLMATLGVYALPIILGLRLPWKLPRPRPRV